jgi:hypothetical protein
MKVAVQNSIGFQRAPLAKQGLKTFYAPDMKAIKKNIKNAGALYWKTQVYVCKKEKADA